MLGRACFYIPRGVILGHQPALFTASAACSSALLTSYRFCASTAKTPTSHEAGSGDSSTTPSAARIRVDPSRLPRTIPGLSPEELASRIEVYQAQLMEAETKLSMQQMAAETEMMRRSLSPEGFEEYLQRTEKMHAKVAKEATKMAAMTPEELYRYQQKQRRKVVRYEWYKTFMLLFVFAASIFFLFFLFFFFT